MSCDFFCILQQSYVIERDGSISTAKTMRGKGNGCDEVAMEAVQNMPNWSPGEKK